MQEEGEGRWPDLSPPHTIQYWFIQSVRQSAYQVKAEVRSTEDHPSLFCGIKFLCYGGEGQPQHAYLRRYLFLCNVEEDKGSPAFAPWRPIIKLNILSTDRHRACLCRPWSVWMKSCLEIRPWSASFFRALRLRCAFRDGQSMPFTHW